MGWLGGGRGGGLPSLRADGRKRETVSSACMKGKREAVKGGIGRGKAVVVTLTAETIPSLAVFASELLAKNACDSLELNGPEVLFCFFLFALLLL